MSAPHARGRGPHVVVVVLDTVRADGPDLGGSGPSAMTALRELTASARVYPDTYSPSPWTLPSHASLFTGAYVWRHGCHERHRSLGEDLPTLAGRLAGAGWSTGAVSANTWVGPDFGLDRGFDRFVRGWRLVDRGGDLAGARRAGREHGRTDLTEALRRAREGGFVPAAINVLHHVLVRRRGRFGGERVARKAVKLGAELRAAGAPVYLFVNFLDAHLRYWPGRRYRNAVLGARAGAARHVNQDAWAFVAGEVAMPPEQLELLRGLYAAELLHLDRVVADFFAGIERTLGLDDTMVVVTSDHGEHLGEHGLMDHQYSLSDVLLRVPLAVRAPGGDGAGVFVGLRQTTDVMPTILRAAGIGHDAAPGLGQPLEEARSWALAEYFGPQPTMAAQERRGDAAPFRRFDRALAALRTAEGRKLVAGSDGSAELYDLATDPGELTDLAPARPDEVATLRRRLAEVAPLPGAAAPTGDDADMSASVRRTLESLGYLQ